MPRVHGSPLAASICEAARQTAKSRSRRKSEKKSTSSAESKRPESPLRGPHRAIAEMPSQSSQSPTPLGNRPRSPCGSYAALDIGELLPHFDAAEMRSLGTDGCGDARPHITGRTDVAGQFGERRPHLRHFLHGGLINLLLRIEAGAHGP